MTASYQAGAHNRVILRQNRTGIIMKVLNDCCAIYEHFRQIIFDGMYLRFLRSRTAIIFSQRVEINLRMINVAKLCCLCVSAC